MRCKQVLWAAVLLAAALVGPLSEAGSSSQTIGGRVVRIGPGQVVKDDLLAAGNTATIEGKVTDNVVAAGSSVRITAEVAKSVIAAGSSVNVSGPIGDDLIATGGNVTISAPIADNAMVAGGTVVLGPGSSVGRDAGIAGSAVELQGRIKRNLRILANSATIGSNIGGSVEARADHLVVASGADVHGDVVLYGPNPPVIQPGAVVEGRVDHRLAEPVQGHPAGPGFGGWILQFLALLALGMAAIAISGSWVEQVGETGAHRTGASLLAGLLGLLVTPLAALLLAITVVGMPVAVLTMMAWITALLLSGVFVAYRIGLELVRRYWRRAPSPFGIYALGTLVLSVAVALPWIGGFIGLLVVLLGMGALIVERQAALSKKGRGPAA